MIQHAHIIDTNVNSAEYHAQTVERGTIEYFMSPSSLKEFARCPERWKAGYESPESKAKDWGNLLDALVLTPKTFAERYAITPASYQTTGWECPFCKSVTDSKVCRKCKCDRQEKLIEKEWNGNAEVCREWITNQGDKEIISDKQHSEACVAASALTLDPIIAAFLEASDRQVLVQGEWHDPDTSLVVPVRCLIDLVPRMDTEFSGSLGDLKTVRCAALIPFQRQVYQMGWHIQGAFDTDLYVAATGEDRNTWCFIVQENFAPWQTAKRILSSVEPGDFMGLGRTEYKAALKAYCACLKAGRWPGYDDTDENVQGWGVASAEPWMELAKEFGPKWQIESDEEAAEEPIIEDVLA